MGFSGHCGLETSPVCGLGIGGAGSLSDGDRHSKSPSFASNLALADPSDPLHERASEVRERKGPAERPLVGLAGSRGRVPSPNNSKSLSASFRVPLSSIGHFGEEQSGRDFWNAKPAVGLQRDRGGKVPVRRSFSGRPRRLRLPNNQAFTVHALPKRG